MSKGAKEKKRISFDAFIIFCQRKSFEKKYKVLNFFFSGNKLAAYSDAYIKILSWNIERKGRKNVRRNAKDERGKWLSMLHGVKNQQALFMSVHRFPLCVNLYEFDAITTHTGTIPNTLIHPQKKLYWTNSWKLLDSILRVCFPSFFSFFIWHIG